MPDKKERLIQIERLAPGFWRLNEPWFVVKNHFGHQTMPGSPHVDAYLLAGTRKAVLIDALEEQFDVPLAEVVRQLTPLPVEAYFTHGHGDHVGRETGGLLRAGIPLHLSMADFPLMLSMAEHFFGGRPDWMREESFIDIRAGETIDLGGTVLETFAMPGHTPGCICFLDRTGRRCFTGDAFGTLILGRSTLDGGSLTEFLGTVARFEDWVGDDACILYNGHASNLGGGYWTLAQLREHRTSYEKANII